MARSLPCRGRPLLALAASSLLAFSTATQTATPNVWEHHARALYVNVPVADATASRLAVEWSRCLQPAKYDGRYWLSVVVDDLDTLWAYFFGGRLCLPTGMSGWMTKVNLLVEGHCIEEQPLPGYQILSLHFERGLAAIAEVVGAWISQQVPSAMARYEMSSGPSGQSMESSMAAGSAYAASMQKAWRNNATLLELRGTLAPPSAEEAAFARFVVERPHKFLAQRGARRVAYSSELGPGASFTAEGVMTVRLDSEVQLPILEPLLEQDELAALNLSAAVAFLQPEYTLVDHHNTVIEREPKTQAGV